MIIHMSFFLYKNATQVNIFTTICGNLIIFVNCSNNDNKNHLLTVKYFLWLVSDLELIRFYNRKYLRHNIKIIVKA
jgi:hypothetical protein